MRVKPHMSTGLDLSVNVTASVEGCLNADLRAIVSGSFHLRVSGGVIGRAISGLHADFSGCVRRFVSDGWCAGLRAYVSGCFSGCMDDTRSAEGNVGNFASTTVSVSVGV